MYEGERVGPYLVVLGCILTAVDQVLPLSTRQLKVIYCSHETQALNTLMFTEGQSQLSICHTTGCLKAAGTFNMEDFSQMPDDQRAVL